MSILLKNICCKHWLRDNKLLLYSNNISNYDVDGIHHIFDIEDSIHYNALKTNDYTFYSYYVTTTNQYEHSVEKFKDLLNNFSLKNMEPIKIKFNNKLKKYIIIDGVHRLSLLVFKKYINTAIDLKYLEITYDNTSINDIKQKLSNTTNQTFYNNWNNRSHFGYHSFNISNINIAGQRRPLLRLNIIKKFVDFNNKTVIDFGCNTGGMLLHLPEIQEGYGLDYSDKCITAANYIKNILGYNNKLHFILQDLNKFSMLNFIKTYNLSNKIDIIFLLSLGSWIKNWETLYINAFKNSKIIILETNNDSEGIPQLELFKQLGGQISLICENSYDDTTNNFGRKAYKVIT